MCITHLTPIMSRTSCITASPLSSMKVFACCQELLKIKVPLHFSGTYAAVQLKAPSQANSYNYMDCSITLARVHTTSTNWRLYCHCISLLDTQSLHMHIRMICESGMEAMHLEGHLYNNKHTLCMYMCFGSYATTLTIMCLDGHLRIHTSIQPHHCLLQVTSSRLPRLPLCNNTVFSRSPLQITSIILTSRRAAVTQQLYYVAIIDNSYYVYKISQQCQQQKMATPSLPN